LARHQAIAATSNALLGLLRDRYPRDDFGTSLEIQLYQSRDFELPMREGFSVFLYRVTVNARTGEHLWQYDFEDKGGHLVGQRGVGMYSKPGRGPPVVWPLRNCLRTGPPFAGTPLAGSML